MPPEKQYPVPALVAAKSKLAPAVLDGQQKLNAENKGKQAGLLPMRDIKRELREMRELGGRLSAMAEEIGLSVCEEQVGGAQVVQSPAAMPPATADKLHVYSKSAEALASTTSKIQTFRLPSARDGKSDSEDYMKWAVERDDVQREALHEYVQKIATYTQQERTMAEAILLDQSFRRSPRHIFLPFTRTRAYFLNWIVTEQPHLSFSHPRTAYNFLCKTIFRCKPVPALISGPFLDLERTWHYKRDGEAKGKRLRNARFEGYWSLGTGDEDVVLLSPVAPDWKRDRYVYAYLKKWFLQGEVERMDGSLRAAKDVRERPVENFRASERAFRDDVGGDTEREDSEVEEAMIAKAVMEANQRRERLRSAVLKRGGIEARDWAAQGSSAKAAGGGG